MPNVPYYQRDTPNALNRTLLHRLLVASERLDNLPAALIAALMLLAAGLVWLVFGWWGGQVAGRIIALSFLGFGVVNTLLFIALPLLKLSWGSWKAPTLALIGLQILIFAVCGLFRLPLTTMYSLVLLLSLFTWYATWIEPFRVGVTRRTLTVRGTSAASGASFTLMHLSDLHLERISPRERIVNGLIRELKPDVIVFTGDYVNISYTDDPVSETHIREVVSEWRAPLGAFGIPGTPGVEPPDRVIAFTEGIETFTLLVNRWTTLQTPTGSVHLLGLRVTHEMTVDRQAFASALEDAPTTPGLRILLTHSPDLAPEAADAGFDLYLCGHTHGGQIRLPLIGPLFTGSHYKKRFAMGLYPLGKMQLYVVRGLGMEGFGAPRARLFCPPEVVLWTINSRE